MNIFKNRSSEKNIFRNEDAFSPDYLPDEMLHRESETREIAFAVSALEDKRRQPTVVIFGPPGTGKTCSAKYVAKEFSEYSQRAVPVYINCWQNSTRYAIISKIAQSVNALVPSTGITLGDLFMRIKEAVAESGKIPLVILDEADVLVKKGEEEIFYDLLRAEEIYGISIGLILITNDIGFISRIDGRTRSSLTQSAVDFSPYGPNELKDILRERAKLGLLPGTYDEEVISVCAGFSAKNGGDARLGINLFWMAAKQAERKNSGKVSLEDIEAVKSKMDVSITERKSGELKEEENKVLAFIKSKKEVSSGEIYSALSLNERTGRNYLSKLEALGFIEAEDKALKSGRTRVFRIKPSK